MRRMIRRAPLLANSTFSILTKSERYFSGSTANFIPKDQLPTKLTSEYITKTEGPSWIAIVPTITSVLPRIQARKLRWAGEARTAHQILRETGAQRSRDEADLIELLLVMLDSDEFKGPCERLEAMVDTLWTAPSSKPRAAFNIVLTACAREANRVSDNSTVKRDVILRTAETIWNELVQSVANPGSKATSLMYRICGDCKDLDLARQIRKHVDDPVVRFGLDENVSHVTSKRSTVEATAAFILCLGKCDRASEAEQLYFSRENEHLTSDRVLSSLFQAYVASNKISKAESLISIFGSSFLNLQSCNAFVKQCASLRLHETAVDFVERMSKSTQTGFPPPSTRTYNLLLRGLSAGTGAEERHVAADRALLVVDAMKKQGIKPTTVTYNTLIRSLAFRNQLSEAFELYHSMESPNRITFSHLMQGAANVGNISLAKEILDMLVQSKERPNYGFCKSYLEIIARTEGIYVAFAEAQKLAKKFGDVLVFGDVGSQEAIRMALINACGKVGKLRYAFDALSLNLPSHTNNVGHLAPLYVATVLMQVCLECNSPGKALEVFQSLKDSGLKPNFEVYESLIYGLSSYVRAAEVNRFNQVHVDDDDFEASPYHGNIRRSDLKPNRSVVKEETINRNFSQDSVSSYPSSTYKNQLDRTDHSEILAIAVQLLREMHIAGVARAYRQAAYVYNTLIAAAAAIGDFELALQIFNRMSRRNNPGVVYVSRDENNPDVELEKQCELTFPMTSSNVTNGHLIGSKTSLADKLFDVEVNFPAATVGTYNSIIAAAWQCGQPQYSFVVFDMMQMDRITEPNGATLGLLADIALADTDKVPIDAQRRLLKILDQVHILSPDVCQKRIRLRQKMLALRWA